MGTDTKKPISNLVTRLKCLGVPDNYLKTAGNILDEGNVDFQNLICWISEELHNLCNLECCVNPVIDNADDLSFIVEVNTLLRELGCPYDALLLGPISQRFQSCQDKQLLLDFLISELCAAKIIYSKGHGSGEKMVVKLKESDTAKILREILIALGFSKPPPTITPQMLFSKVEKKLSDLISQHHLEIYPPLFCGMLTEKQWFQLQKLQEEMVQDYKSRRVMVIERLNLTTQSFSWSCKVKGVRESIAKVYNSESNAFIIYPTVHVGDLLAARTDLTIMEKTSGASVRKNMKSSIYSVLIGSVPDRGGRPDEQQPPPPEIPSWQKSTPSPQQRPNVGNNPSYEDKKQFERYAKHSENQKNRSDNYAQHTNYESSKYKSHHEHNQPGNYLTNIQSSGYSTQTPQVNPGYQFQEVHQYPAQTAGGFGYGFGGYAATGGNFQQYGMIQQPVEMHHQQQFYGNQTGGRGYSQRGGRGQRRSRGNYSHQQGHQQHGY